MLLNWLGERRGDAKFAEAASMIEHALDQTIARPEYRTADLGGPLGTKAFGERVAAAVEGLARR
jgi:3-isopropylmalate dehydrogenase